MNSILVVDKNQLLHSVNLGHRGVVSDAILESQSHPDSLAQLQETPLECCQNPSPPKCPTSQHLPTTESTSNTRLCCAEVCFQYVSLPSLTSVKSSSPKMTLSAYCSACGRQAVACVMGCEDAARNAGTRHTAASCGSQPAEHCTHHDACLQHNRGAATR